MWAISPATITGVLNLSFNFFYVLPLANLGTCLWMDNFRFLCCYSIKEFSSYMHLLTFTMN